MTPLIKGEEISVKREAFPKLIQSQLIKITFKTKNWIGRLDYDQPRPQVRRRAHHLQRAMPGLVRRTRAQRQQTLHQHRRRHRQHLQRKLPLNANDHKKNSTRTRVILVARWWSTRRTACRPKWASTVSWPASVANLSGPQASPGSLATCSGSRPTLASHSGLEHARPIVFSDDEILPFWIKSDWTKITQLIKK